MSSDKATVRRERGSRERGITTVEFGLLLLPVVMLTMGAFDFGRAYFQSQVILQAAQEGVRTAALPTSTTSTVNAAITAILTPAKLTAATISSSNVGVGASRGATSSVTVSIPFNSLTGTIFPSWIGTHTLTQTAKQRHE
jgi:Flp pilus assembly protein TadG